VWRHRSPLRRGHKRSATAPRARGDQSETRRIERRARGFYQCFPVPAPKTTERPGSQWNFYRTSDCPTRVSREHDRGADDARPKPLKGFLAPKCCRARGVSSELMTKNECRMSKQAQMTNPENMPHSLKKPYVI